MPSTISAGTTGGTAIAFAGDTSGELQLRTNGTTPAVTISTAQNATFAGSVSATNTFGFENRIINGAMVIDQRNAGASVAVLTNGNPSFSVDRFYCQAQGGGGYSIQQVTVAPQGFANSIVATVTTADTSVTSTDFYAIKQRIEGFNVADLNWGTANAKTVTLSFWVRSSLTGTFSGSLMNSAENRSYPYTYTISSANTWEQKSVTIVGDTTGTWLTNNGNGMAVSFTLGVGSTYQGTAGSWAGSRFEGATGQTQWISTNGATFYITGVQLEVGSLATSFDFRSIGQELLLCQRYYQNVGANFYGNTEGTTTYNIQVPFYCAMRALPSVSVRSGYIFNGRYLGGDINITTPTVANVTPGTLSGVWMQVISSGLTNGAMIYGRCQNSNPNVWSSTNDFLAISAEL